MTLEFSALVRVDGVHVRTEIFYMDPLGQDVGSLENRIIEEEDMDHVRRTVQVEEVLGITGD